MAENEISLEELGRRLDIIGQQTDWMCENLQSLFLFVHQMSSNGGGIRGMIAALRQAQPEMVGKPPVVDTNNIGANSE